VHQAEECVATIASSFALRATADLALDDLTAKVALGAVGVEWYSWPVERRQQLGLVGVQPRHQTIERDEVGAAAKDAIKADAHLTASPSGRHSAVGFEVSVEPPNQRPEALLRGAVQVREGIQLMHQSLGVHPTQSMPTNRELTGVITDDDGIAQEPVSVDAAP